MNLKAEQRRLYALMPAEARCFVRVCDDDCALWVSDLPRKVSDCNVLAQRLRKEGFAVWVNESVRLWYIDWTAECWQSQLAELPQEIPALPLQDEYHEAYALCRLWMLHAAPVETEHLPALRRVTKLTSDHKSKMLRAVRSLHEETATRLRKGKTIPHAAGRVLAAWLYEHAYGKENEP